MDHYNRCEDFLADAYFRQWVKQPDEKSTRYWQTFLTEHPEKADLVRQATDLVRAMSDAASALADPADDQTRETVWEAIHERIRPSHFAPMGESKVYRLGYWLTAAASILLLLGLGWWLRIRHETNPVALHKPVGAGAGNGLIVQANTTPAPQWIALPDGSSVILQPGGQLTYPKQFRKAQRSVDLTGEAFFEVTKDPARPFLVHANGLLTKVLGTSFTVRAYGHDKAVTVTVRTGRVAVYAQSPKSESHADSPTLDGMVLTPNQRVVYERQEARLIRVKSLVPPAQLLPKGMAVNLTRYVFDARPVSEVFDALEKGYGVRIRYDKSALDNCRLTADLTDATLTEKLLIICKSIEAEYVLQPGEIVVSGPGCRP